MGTKNLIRETLIAQILTKEIAFSKPNKQSWESDSDLITIAAVPSRFEAFTQVDSAVFERGTWSLYSGVDEIIVKNKNVSYSFGSNKEVAINFLIINKKAWTPDEWRCLHIEKYLRSKECAMETILAEFKKYPELKLEMREQLFPISFFEE
jgi:hypothetical protein